MKVLLLGSTGYLGSAITDRLLGSDHHVVAVVRTGDEPDPRTEARIGDLGSPDSLRAALTPDIDAVVHAAAPLGDWELERASVQAMIESLGAPEKVLVYISGAWVLGQGPDLDGESAGFDEASPVRPIRLVAGRETVEGLVTTSPVTGVVLRPGIAHGRGGGIPGMLTAWAREHGVGRFVGSGTSVTWPVVHVDDLARLVELALEKARPGDILHGVTQAAVPVMEIAEAADLAAGGRGTAEAWDLVDASDLLGPEFAGALATSQSVLAQRAFDLGWRPEQPDIVSDLVRGSYVGAARSI